MPLSLTLAWLPGKQTEPCSPTSLSREVPRCSGACRSRACSMRLSSRVKLTCHSELWVPCAGTERTDCLARQVRKLKPQEGFGALTIDTFSAHLLCAGTVPHPTLQTVISALTPRELRPEGRGRLSQAPTVGEQSQTLNSLSYSLESWIQLTLPQGKGPHS